MAASPGEMHPIDEAFYKLAIQERDFERHQVDRLRVLLTEACDLLEDEQIDAASPYAKEEATRIRKAAGI